MNSETLVRIKTEPLDRPFDESLCEVRNYSAFTDLSNRRINKCLDCKNQVDYECPSCICRVCLYQTTVEKRYRCFICHKVFHESCRDNPEQASSTGKWLCCACKTQEKQYASTFMPCIQEVITKAHEKVAIFPDIKSEKIDWNGCESEKLDSNGWNTEKLDLNANNTCDKPREMASDLNNTHMDGDTKDQIVDIVAKGLLQKGDFVDRKNIVPPIHFGPIPGIPVGTCWKYRLQVSRCGVHRPLVAGISGRGNEGACSIVLSGVYAEDKDFGDEFFYSGCGGRERDPHKRLMAQTQDQTLTRYNKALAISCNAPFNDQIGAEAVDWQGGKPVRVIRNYKLKKHSQFAPAEGNRYDGIYKVVKYYPTIGRTGLLVWRYLLRRDDPEPAPWTEEGKRIIEEKGLQVIWPSEPENKGKISVKDEFIERPFKKIAYDYTNAKKLLYANAVNKMHTKLESKRFSPVAYPPSFSTPVRDFVVHAEIDVKPNVNVLQNNLSKQQHSYNYNNTDHKLCTLVSAPVEPASNLQLIVSSVRSLHQKTCDSSTNVAQSHPVPDSNFVSEPNASDIARTVKDDYEMGLITIKEEAVELPAEVEKLIDADKANGNIWEYCKTYLKKGKNDFLDTVKLMFTCRYCCRVARNPLTTPCIHNVCMECITNLFAEASFSCPDCHYYLGPSFQVIENKNLSSVLENLLPGYNLMS